MQKPIHQIYSFDEFTLDLTRGCLLRETDELKLRPKSFEVLKYLVENCGRLIGKDEIIGAVWQEMAVTDDSLVQCMKDIRRALDDKSQEIIKTVPRRGYIFEKEVSENGGIIYPEETAGVDPVVEEGVGSGDAEKALQRGEESIELRKLSKRTTLFGREKEIVGIKNLLRRDDVQIATLTGTGGTGKTRLAQAVADDCSAEFADGVFFIGLANINDAELVPSAIANTLGVKESRGKSLFENLIDSLRKKRLLLVLDNFEQIISAAPLLAQLTEALPKLKILVTSRAALHTRGEYELIVPPLAVPPKDPVIGTLENYSAVKLFVARAQTPRSNFILSNENASVVGEICSRLDGLPLAIELAAARVKLLSPLAILGRLENSLKLLTSRTPDLPARQQTMRGVVEWSYDLLDVDEKLLFNRLAVFAGGFTIEAAEAVTEGETGRKGERETDSSAPKTLGISGVNNTNAEENLVAPNLSLSPHLPISLSVLDGIESLIDKNLLVSKEQSGGETRLRMLEVIREFASEKLEESGEAEIFRRRHAEYFLALAEEAEPHLQATDAGEWLNRLEDEHDNSRAAIRWLFETDAEKAARLAAAMRGFWIFHNYLTEGRGILETALQHATADVLFKLLNGLGMLAKYQGDYAAAQIFYEKGLAAGKAANDLRQIALASRGLGGAVQLQGDFTTAREFMEEGLAISRELDDQAGIAVSLNFLGDLARQENNDAAARPLYEEALAISRGLGNKQNVCANLNNLGFVVCGQGDYGAAHSNFAEALKTAQESGYKIVISYSLDGFAALAAKQKDWKMSAQLAGAAEKLRETIGCETETPDKMFRQDYLEKVCGALGETAFAETIQAGRLLKLDEAIALAEADKTDFADNAGTQNGTAIYTEETAGIHIVIEESEETGYSDIIETHRTQSGTFAPFDADEISRQVFAKQRGINDAPVVNLGGTRHRYQKVAILSSAAVFVFVGVFLWWFYANKTTAEKTPPMSAALFQNVEVRNITHVGNIVNNAISFDGKYVVYTTTDNGRESLWLRQIATNSTQRVLPPTEFRYFGVSFSRDGEYIYYLRSDRANPFPRTLYRIPKLGGVVEKVLEDMNWCPTFSPDGHQIAFVRNSSDKNTSVLMIADASGSNEREVATRTLNEAYSFPAWSPDGQTIAATAGSAELGDSFRDVVTVNVSDSAEKTLTTRKWYWITQAAWLADGSGLIMSANPKKGYFLNQLWLLSYPSGEARQITNDSNNYHYVSLTADSRTLLAGHTELLTHLWIAPEGDSARARRVSYGLGDYKHIRWTPDGKLAVAAFGNKNVDIYLRDADGAEIKQLTVNAGTNWGNEVSPDNRFIVFDSDRTGDFHIWRMDIDGGNPVQLTNGSGEKFAEISPDGKWVVYTSFQDWTLWKIAIQGGEPVKIADAFARQAAISPHGKWIVYMASETNRQIVIPFDGGAPVKIFDLPTDAPLMQPVRWSSDSQAIQFIVKRDGVDNIWQQPLDGSSPRQITNFTADNIYSYDWSDDGKTLAVIRGAWTADMVLMSQK